MKCQQCGNSIPSRAKFCAYCGKQFMPIPRVTPTSQTLPISHVPPVQATKQVIPFWAKWASLVALIGVGLTIWAVLSSMPPRVSAISDFQVFSESSGLKATFSLVDAKNNSLAAGGNGQLMLYDNARQLIYQQPFSFVKRDFRTSFGRYDYSISIPKGSLQWVIPVGDFDARLLTNGQATVKITMDKGKTFITKENPTVKLLSESEAEITVKELYMKRAQEKLRLALQQVKASLEKWVYDHRYSLSEFGGFGYPIDISIDDYSVVGNQAWAVGYLHGIGGYGHIFHSPDLGSTWEVQWKSSTWGPDPFDIEFLDDKEGWAAADDAILHTSNSGKTWEAVYTRGGLGGWIRSFKVIDRQNLQAVNSNGQTLYSSDGGKNWETRPK